MGRKVILRSPFHILSRSPEVSGYVCDECPDNAGACARFCHAHDRAYLAHLVDHPDCVNADDAHRARADVNAP